MCVDLGHGLASGTGKTVTTLTALDLLLNDYLEDGPVLVIAPKRVALDTWTSESEGWAHLAHLRVSTVIGTQKQRVAALAAPADIYVINRENVVWLVEYLGGAWPFPIVVVDELSSFKSSQAKRWRALRRVRGRIRRFIGLTGTPRPNGLEDLWPQLYLLDLGDRLGKTLSAFRTRYLVPEKMNGHVVYSYRPKPGAEEDVYGRISDICISIKKDDVLSLPGQIYTDVVVRPSPDILKKYKTFEREKVLECLDSDGEVVAGSAAALTNKLLQFANGAIYDMDGGVHELHGLKLDALEELVEQAIHVGCVLGHAVLEHVVGIAVVAEELCYLEAQVGDLLHEFLVVVLVVLYVLCVVCHVDFTAQVAVLAVGHHGAVAGCV